MSDHEVDPAVGGLFEQVHALVALELTGELTEADRARLDRLVCDSPEARRLYAQYMAETAALERYMAAGAALTGAAALDAAAAGNPAFGSVGSGSVGSGGAALPQSPSAAGPPLEFGAAPSGVLGFLGGLFDAIQASPRLLRVSVLVGLGTYFGIVLTTVVWQRTWNVEHLEPLAATVGRSEAGHSEIARLVSARNCRWLMAGAAPVEGDALGARPLRLAAGVAEIQFAGGATVVLSAPAVFTPQTAGRSLLSSGRLVARVPPAAVGFTVTTPMVEVIDLGTEFGLEVDGPRRTDVHVLRGEVEVKQLVDDAVTAEPGMRLIAGQAVRLTEGVQFTNIPVDRGRFSQTLGAGTAWSITRADIGLAGRSSAISVGDLSFAESFSDRTAARQLMLGTGFGSPEVDFDGAFTITSGPQSRIYLLTKRADYSAVNFTFEATVHMPLSSDPWGDAFFGMAAGGATTMDMPGEPMSPSALAVIRLDDATASNKPELQTRDTTHVHSTATASAVIFADADAPGGDVQRLRMKWNASTQQARFEVAVHYRGGPFTPDYALAVNGADNGFDATNSRLILGGGNGLSFDDISVEVESADLSQPPKEEATE